MPRIRTIKPEFFSHEELAGKSPHARLLAIGLLTLADCEGRLRWVPMQVHAQVFPWEATVKIEVLLGELIDCGYVVHYEEEGKRYAEVVNFTKHQRLSGKEAHYKSRLPAPPAEITKDPELPCESGEATVKHPDASQGTLRNRGTIGTIGTGEQGNHRNSIKPPKAEIEKPADVTDQAWADWKATRKSKRAGPITPTALSLIESEAEKAGISLEEAVTLAAGSGWITFKADYIKSGSAHKPVTFAQQRVENSKQAMQDFLEMDIDV